MQVPLWSDNDCSHSGTVPDHPYRSQDSGIGRTQWRVVDPEPWVSVQLYLCVSADFMPPLHFLDDCYDDDACVMKKLKHDIGGRSTEACI